MATNIWKELPESGGGAGTITDINGATGPSITIDAGTGIDVTTVGDTITITNTGSNPTGTPHTFAGFDGTGALETIPGFAIDTTSGGMNENLTEHPNNVGGVFSANSLNVQFQPLQNSPNDTWNIQSISTSFDTANSGFSQGTAGSAANMLNLFANHGGTGDIGGLAQVSTYFNIGNGTDPITSKGFAYFFGFADINDNVTIDGTFQGFDFQPHIHSGALSTSNFNMYAFSDSANIEIPVNSYTSALLGPLINSVTNNNNYSGVTINPVIPTLVGNASVHGYGFYPTITTIGATGNINILNSNPTITTMGANSGFNGINMGGTITTMGASSNVIGMYFTPVITTSHGSVQGININPQINGGDANVTGMSINVSGSATGLQNIRGVTIQLNNVPTTDSSGPIALETDSRLSINGTTTPLSAQTINIGTRIEHLFQIESGSPLTGTDLLGLDLAGDLLAQDNMAVGPIGIGFSSVGFIADMAVAVGKTVDLIHVFLPAVALPDPGFTTGGTVTTMEFIHLQAPLLQGGTITTTNLYGMRIMSDFSTTTSPTNAWGISIEDTSLKNTIAGNLEIGSLTSNGNLIPVPSNSLAIGNSSSFWRDLTVHFINDLSSIIFIDSNNRFITDVLGNPALSFNSGAVVRSVVDFEVNEAHYLAFSGTPPSVTVSANAGTGATGSTLIRANDVAGTVELVTGTLALAAGAQITVNFNVAYANAPTVTLTPKNTTAASAAVSVYVTSTTAGFTINFVTASIGSQTFDWFYHVIGLT